MTGGVVAQELIHEIRQGIRRTCEFEVRDPAVSQVLEASEVYPVPFQVGDYLGGKIANLRVRRQVDVHLDLTKLTHGAILAPVTRV